MNYKKNYIILGIFASAAIGSVYIGGKLASRFKNEIAISNPVSRSFNLIGKIKTIEEVNSNDLRYRATLSVDSPSSRQLEKTILFKDETWASLISPNTRVRFTFKDIDQSTFNKIIREDLSMYWINPDNTITLLYEQNGTTLAKQKRHPVSLEVLN